MYLNDCEVPETSLVGCGAEGKEDRASIRQASRQVSGALNSWARWVAEELEGFCPRNWSVREEVGPALTLAHARH